MATGLEKVSFHSNPKETQCQGRFKLLHICTNFTCQQRNIQNSPSQTSTVHEWRTPRCSSWNFEQTEELGIKLPTSIESQKKQENSRKTSPSASLTTLKPLTVWITTNWKILKEMGIPDHLTYLLRNLYSGEESPVRTGHGTTAWFQIGKGVRQGCVLSVTVGGHKFIMYSAHTSGPIVSLQKYLQKIFLKIIKLCTKRCL